MTTLPLTCGVNDFIVDASSSSMTVNSLNSVSLNSSAGNIVLNATAGHVQLSGFGSGVASFDSSGNISSVSGSVFNTSSNWSVSGTWTFNSSVTISSAATQASVLGVPTTVPPSGYSHVVMNNTTGQLYRLT